MDAAKEAVIALAEDYMQSLDISRVHSFGEDFRKLCYIRSAIAEILELLGSENDTPALDILEDYRDTMYRFSLVDPKTEMMFELCGQTAEYFIRLLT